MTAANERRQRHLLARHGRDQEYRGCPLHDVVGADDHHHQRLASRNIDHERHQRHHHPDE